MNNKKEVIDTDDTSIEESYDQTQISKKSLGQILIQDTDLTEEQLQEAISLQKDSYKRKLGEILVEKELVSEEQILKALAAQLDLPYYNRLPIAEIDPELVKDLPIQFCRDNLILPIAQDAFSITVVVADPLNIFPMDDLRMIKATNISMIISSPSVITNAINQVFERSSDSTEKKVIDALNVGEDSSEDLEEARDLLDSSDDDKPIIRLVNSLLARSVKEGATDIHIEPYDTEIVVRFRIDGILHDAMQIPKRHLSSVVSRIKIIGKLNIAEKRVPQDGRITIKVAGKDIDVRLSVLPTAFGERIVMRLLPKSSGMRRLEDMGMDPTVFAEWKALIKQTHGIILVTGPTGSGKTSLLYSSVVDISSVDINILTIEEPVEYTLAGVGQIDVKVKVGLTFAAGLRSILRQDPDVIMIGEIRDEETASISVQAALTGHLVFSTVHTNDAPSTIARLSDLKVKPFQIASSVLGVMATRLIRRLCENCKQEYKLTKREIEMLGVSEKDLKGKKIYRSGGGCDQCHNQGYLGRTPIHELLVMTEEIRETIQKTQDTATIRKIALKSGMLTLRRSAIEKILSGITSIEEGFSKSQTEELEVNLDEVNSDSSQVSLEEQ